MFKVCGHSSAMNSCLHININTHLHMHPLYIFAHIYIYICIIYSLCTHSLQLYAYTDPLCVTFYGNTHIYPLNLYIHGHTLYINPFLYLHTEIFPVPMCKYRSSPYTLYISLHKCICRNTQCECISEVFPCIYRIHHPWQWDQPRPQ